MHDVYNNMILLHIPFSPSPPRAHGNAGNVKLTFYMRGFKNIISPQENRIYKNILYYTIPQIERNANVRFKNP